MGGAMSLDTEGGGSIGRAGGFWRDHVQGSRVKADERSEEPRSGCLDMGRHMGRQSRNGIGWRTTPSPYRS